MLLESCRDMMLNREVKKLRVKFRGDCIPSITSVFIPIYFCKYDSRVSAYSHVSSTSSFQLRPHSPTTVTWQEAMHEYPEFGQ